MSMKSRCVVVTGASGNLGRAVVERLERAGGRVAALTHADADLTDEAQVEAAYEKVLQRNGAIWGSVHCAGGWAGAPFADTDLAMFEKMIALILCSTFLCCPAAPTLFPGETLFRY